MYVVLELLNIYNNNIYKYFKFNVSFKSRFCQNAVFIHSYLLYTSKFYIIIFEINKHD